VEMLRTMENSATSFYRNEGSTDTKRSYGIIAIPYDCFF